MKTTTTANAATVLTIDSIPELATCTVDDLKATFARARVAVASANIQANRTVARTMTLSFVSLIGR
jgi:hypothetical protein